MRARTLPWRPVYYGKQHQKQELGPNPFRELTKPEEEGATPATTDKQAEQEKSDQDEPDWENILLDDGAEKLAGSPDLSGVADYVEPTPVETKDLIDHLREQLQMLDLTPRQQLLAEEFLGNIKEDGYLTASLDQIVAAPNHLIAQHPDEIAKDADVPWFTLPQFES